MWQLRGPDDPAGGEELKPAGGDKDSLSPTKQSVLCETLRAHLFEAAKKQTVFRSKTRDLVYFL